LRTRIVEATSLRGDWGKFLVGSFDDDEWVRLSRVSDSNMSLLAEIGYEHTSLLVVDLSTGEAAVFTPPERLSTYTAAQWQFMTRARATSDLTQHRIEVSPLFAPFLAWLYAQVSFDDLPDDVEFDAPLVAPEYRHMWLVANRGREPT
jgi:hypothetical protein